MLAAAIPVVRISAASNPQVKSGVDRLYVIDCGDGSGSDESRWTPGVNVGKPVGFPGRCYLIHHTQGWVLWDTGIDDAVAQLPTARVRENFDISALPDDALNEINRIQTRQRLNEVVKTGVPGFIAQGR